MILDDFSARQSVVARTLSTNHLLETATQDTDSEALVDNSVRLLPAAKVSGARDVPERDRSPLVSAAPRLISALGILRMPLGKLRRRGEISCAFRPKPLAHAGGSACAF